MTCAAFFHRTSTEHVPKLWLDVGSFAPNSPTIPQTFLAKMCWSNPEGGYKTNFMKVNGIRWVEEILHHLGWLKPYEQWDVYHRFQLVQDFATIHSMVLE